MHRRDTICHPQRSLRMGQEECPISGLSTDACVWACVVRGRGLRCSASRACDHKRFSQGVRQTHCSAVLFLDAVFTRPVVSVQRDKPCQISTYPTLLSRCCLCTPVFALPRPSPLCDQIGPHGAGLFHIIFAPDRAHLIELQIDQTSARKHFNNLAKWSGHLYTARGGRNPVDVGGTQSMVRNVIDGMDLSRH